MTKQFHSWVYIPKIKTKILNQKDTCTPNFIAALSNYLHSPRYRSNPPGSSVHGIFQAGILECVASSFSRVIYLHLSFILFDLQMFFSAQLDTWVYMYLYATNLII